MRKWAVIVACLAASVCGRTEDTLTPATTTTPALAAPATSAPAAQPPLMQVLRSGPALASAFAAAYERPAPVAARGLDPESPDQFYTISPSALIQYGNAEILVSDVTTPETAHAFVGGIALHVFKRGDGGARTIVATAPLITGGLGFGRPAPWAVRTDLFGTPALVVKSGWRGGGCVADFETLFEPLATGGTAVARSILVHHQSEQADATTGVIAPEVADQSFTVTYSGATVRTLRYVRSGPRFDSKGSPEDLPGC